MQWFGLLIGSKLCCEGRFLRSFQELESLHMAMAGTWLQSAVTFLPDSIVIYWTMGLAILGKKTTGFDSLLY
ncbi:hypothetical protein NC652_023892 [Populus alba x Populus x berolinensis]|nr:hypothetical protein NC652_023892 [Populus alba x Populus x berolinensis]